MSDRTQKRVGHGRKRQVRDGRREEDKKWGRYLPTLTACDRGS